MANDNEFVRNYASNRYGIPPDVLTEERLNETREMLEEMIRPRQQRANPYAVYRGPDEEILFDYEQVQRDRTSAEYQEITRKLDKLKSIRKDVKNFIRERYGSMFGADYDPGHHFYNERRLDMAIEHAIRLYNKSVKIPRRETARQERVRMEFSRGAPREAPVTTNIFFLDDDPELAARAHIDKHIAIMLYRYYTILSSVHKNMNTPYSIRMTRNYNPLDKVVSWAKADINNYFWLLALTHFMFKEYQHRYKKTHKLQSKLRFMYNVPVKSKDDLEQLNLPFPGNKIPHDFIINIDSLKDTTCMILVPWIIKQPKADIIAKKKLEAEHNGPVRPNRIELISASRGVRYRPKVNEDPEIFSIPQVESYRTYYVARFHRYAKWKHRVMPEWWEYIYDQSLTIKVANQMKPLPNRREKDFQLQQLVVRQRDVENLDRKIQRIENVLTEERFQHIRQRNAEQISRELFRFAEPALRTSANPQLMNINMDVV